MPSTRKPLKRLRRRISDDEPRYWHPHGWVIYRQTRDWNLGGITRGAQHQWTPKHWWEVKKANTSNRRREDFLTLKEAREWCDEHPIGWPA